MNRTLVKSPPELWSEFSEVERLANYLGEFGEITIRRLEPEHMVAWEGDHVCGTVELEASGRGTRVTMKAGAREVEAQGADLPPPTVHQVIPDLEAWDRSAAEIESHAGRQTPAAQRAAERAAERAHRERKGGLARRLFRGRRSEHEAATVGPSPLPDPTNPESPDHTAQAPQFLEPPGRPTGRAKQPEEAAEGGARTVDEHRARAVLEAALDNLGGAQHRPVSRH